MESTGHSEFLRALERDPYGLFDRLRATGPVHWFEALRMWIVVDFETVNAVLQNSQAFVTGTAESLIFDTFGENMLTVEGAAHLRYRMAFRGAFAPKNLRTAFTDHISLAVDRLIDEFEDDGEVDLRQSFASRLPIQVILKVFGLSVEHEPAVRGWYDNFEAALANFQWDKKVRDRAKRDVAAFHQVVQKHLDDVRGINAAGLLAASVNSSVHERQSDDEIRRNALIIMFGGISTVEALLLNAIYAVLSHDGLPNLLIEDPRNIPKIIEETMRWLSPVQSATRHVVRNVELSDVTLKAGDTVNCMLGAANHDPSMFPHPKRFDFTRANIKRHLGFAAGPHFCLGSHLARLETEISLQKLFKRFPDLRLAEGAVVEIVGYEFRQPRALNVAWNTMGRGDARAAR